MINDTLKEIAGEFGISLIAYQSNWEGRLIDWIQGAKGNYDYIIINPGTLTYYSYSLKDAIVAVGIPTIEVHLTNIHNREGDKQESVILPAVKGAISGLGSQSYYLALQYIIATANFKEEG
jgi:3-dehydroquinate dehydratase-2